jgi:phosphoglycerate kinase
MKSLQDLNFSGKTVLVRVDFNVPMNDAFEITDDRRMRAALPTLHYILEKGGSLVLMSHFGRPKNGPEDKYSLRHLQEHLSVLLGREVKFANDCIGSEALSLSNNLKAGEVLLLENVRFHAQETKGDREFAKQLSLHGQVFVNDAFGSAHRAHSSVSVVAEFFEEKCAGFLLEAEVKNAERVLTHIERPYLAIVGGAKVSDKILVLENLLGRVNSLVIGGGMAYTFLKAQGFEIGTSLCEEDRLDVAKKLMEDAKTKGVNLILPDDSVVFDKFDKTTTESDTVTNADFPANKMGLDIGPETRGHVRDAILASKTILWNGPMGVFENPTFAGGTIAAAEALVEATSHGAYSLIGGGDTAAAVEQYGFSDDKFSFVSTGGGALLEYLEGKVLPGVAALN